MIRLLPGTAETTAASSGGRFLHSPKPVTASWKRYLLWAWQSAPFCAAGEGDGATCQLGVFFVISPREVSRHHCEGDGVHLVAVVVVVVEGNSTQSIPTEYSPRGLVLTSCKLSSCKRSGTVLL
jgi:hypothetical protein